MRAATNEGQWALGYREPRNQNEQTKREDDGLNVRSRIERVYATKGFDSIPSSDLRQRFRWYGLYTQRPESDGYFMLRVRIPGGALSADQVDAIGRLSERYGRDVSDVTDRQNVQLHWIRIDDVPSIWEELEAVGLSTVEACGDTPRNLLGCPLAGIDATEIVDAASVVEDANAKLAGNPEFSNLPRKFKISISGCAHQCAQHEINDIGLVGAVHPDGRKGFDVWVGGGLSTSPMFARRLGAFVPPERAADVVAGITTVFRDWGYRRARNRARMKFLVKDWGPDKFRAVLEDVLGYELDDLPEPPASSRVHSEHIGVGDQKDGLKYVGFALRAGRTSGHQLRAVARLSRRFGRGRVRATTQQKMVILDVEPSKVEALIEELDAIGLVVRASSWRRGVMACTGIEFCKLAIVETKGRAHELFRYLEDRLPDFEEDVRINVNGCPNSCARYQTADIGLMGCQLTQKVLEPDETGNLTESKKKVEGFLVHLGGHLGANRSFARKVRGVKVPAGDVGPYVEAVIRRYRSRRRNGESFPEFVARLSDDELKTFAEAAGYSGGHPAPQIIAEPRAQ
jgi:sulfite reductase (ferredoxin)